VGGGTAGVTGAASAANSLISSSANDYVGDIVFAPRNSNYVVGSPVWTRRRGAAT
jgi:hypothetical protein